MAKLYLHDEFPDISYTALGEEAVSGQRTEDRLYVVVYLIDNIRIQFVTVKIRSLFLCS